METVLKAISDWIKSLLTAAIMSNLSGLFDDVNTQVGNIAQQGKRSIITHQGQKKKHLGQEVQKIR